MIYVSQRKYFFLSAILVAKALTLECCNVVLADHDVRGIEKVISEFPQQSTPPSYTQIKCDVTDPIQVQNLIKQADEFAKSCDHTSC